MGNTEKFIIDTVNQISRGQCRAIVVNKKEIKDRENISCVILFRIELLGGSDNYLLRFTQKKLSGVISNISCKVSFTNNDKITRYDFSEKKGYHSHIEMFDEKNNKIIEKTHVPIKICGHDNFLRFIIEQSLEHFH